MLMRKQVLLPATKKAFDIRRDPFELQSAEDIFINADIRYVREAMHQVAMHDGFLAVIGESGAGKSTLRRDLEHRLEGTQAHSLSTPTIKHLKRYRELELGYTKLVSIILIGQPELLIVVAAQRRSP